MDPHGLQTVARSGATLIAATAPKDPKPAADATAPATTHPPFLPLEDKGGAHHGSTAGKAAQARGRKAARVPAAALNLTIAPIQLQLQGKPSW